MSGLYCVGWGDRLRVFDRLHAAMRYRNRLARLYCEPHFWEM